MTSLLLLCIVNFTTFSLGHLEAASRTCAIAESEEEAAWTVYAQHRYGYPEQLKSSVPSVTLYRLDTLTMTLTEIPLKIVEVKEQLEQNKRAGVRVTELGTLPSIGVTDLDVACLGKMENAMRIMDPFLDPHDSGLSVEWLSPVTRERFLVWQSVKRECWK
jgi:hypothetical protein